MSVTVSYKGNTLTTVSNQTRTLLTAGKYMEGDLTLTDSGSGYVINEVANTTGTTAVISGDPITLITKNISANGTYNASSDNADGYSRVVVSVSGGSGGGGGTSATQHIIHLEFTDSTDTDINVYYDDSLIGTMITSYELLTYGGKTVDVAELDGVAWYTRPTETWETLYNGNVGYYPDEDNVYPYCWIPDLSDVTIAVGSVWRITYENVEYICTATLETIGSGGATPVIGDHDFSVLNSTPFYFFNPGWGAWTGSINAPNTSTIKSIKIERLVT